MVCPEMAKTSRSLTSNNCRVLHTTIIVPLTIIPSAFASSICHERHSSPQVSHRLATRRDNKEVHCGEHRGNSWGSDDHLLPLGTRRIAWDVSKYLSKLPLEDPTKGLTIYPSNLGSHSSHKQVRQPHVVTEDFITPYSSTASTFSLPARVSHWEIKVLHALARSCPSPALPGVSCPVQLSRCGSAAPSRIPPNTWPEKLSAQQAAMKEEGLLVLALL